MFTQEEQIKENIKAPHHLLCEGRSPVIDEFPAQRASNVENVFIWWRRHVTIGYLTQVWSMQNANWYQKYVYMEYGNTHFIVQIKAISEMKMNQFNWCSYMSIYNVTMYPKYCLGICKPKHKSISTTRNLQTNNRLEWYLLNVELTEESG